MKKVLLFLVVALMFASCEDVQNHEGEEQRRDVAVNFDSLQTKELPQRTAQQGTVNAGQAAATREEQLFQQAMVYFTGDGVAVDKKKAFDLCQQSAEMGFAPAQFNVAIFYYNGDGVERNHEKVFYWMEKAANQEYLQAMIQLSKCYRMGLGTKRDDVKGTEWLEKAAKNGDVESQYLTGMAYYKGVGVVPDYERAVVWYERAAKGGSSEAMNELGLCYENGLGVFRLNKDEALKWYKKSADKGNKIGAANYERLKNDSVSPIFEIKN